MKRWFLTEWKAPLVGLAAALAVPAAAQNAAPKSLDSVKGAFHEIHAAGKIGLACGACHSWSKPDRLFLRFDEIQGPGPVDRNGCIKCHKPPEKPAWYFAKPSG